MQLLCAQRRAPLTHRRTALVSAPQITLADWLGCVITALFANALHGMLRALLREQAGWLTGDVTNGLHVTLAAALTMWMRTWNF